ncbi:MULTISPECIES: OsmC family protein [unclassified Oceanobacter]|jgi:organic hydroperoxide reductase OsmC/OhrA|uniref:OsmC family protein n=1 Tax=unclassified Oceanobacter TaxID=2620260 RepID=UPI0026E1C2F2|nr:MULTISPECIES: OsmC family protein [unclassified Oceanobacter]MDO6681916.1 OsmC family protein [Oceanobacter sp. 5_MG-2023]MDP2505278.1 OsmC family protein [Oceanobacter sp. 3_MG-2023]MDP2547952.1 OsmC family protein [Oceanobacter sp. 4_MG-2023]MDP2609891.1 OsmC family protein [Oceanobacter sp. 1_MG-2023]MDP2612231.1 OsmC family protein [Oceanobacter sp. 2_MG-2023]
MTQKISEHSMDLHWQREGEFSHQGFERRHQLDFGHQVQLAAGGAGNDYGSDPEQMLAASMASCHMMTFLALAAKKRLNVVSYEDHAVAELAQRDDGRFHISRILLSPLAVFEGDKIPDAEAILAMHHKAHEHCFIANSVLCEVEVNPR